MDSTQFVQEIKKSVVDESLLIYQDLFQNSTNATDPYWIEALSFFSTLNIEQKTTFFKIIRQIEVDTTSTILGIIDGVVSIGEFDELLLINAEENKTLNGALQDEFLALENE